MQTHPKQYPKGDIAIRWIYQSPCRQWVSIRPQKLILGLLTILALLTT